LNVDTTKVPQLKSNNIFSGTQQFANTGIGMVPSGTSYTPLSVGTANSFGTWLAISNTSTGGHTWNIISAGGANAEGAGNLGITDLTGKSTIWLEGNTNTGNLMATGNGLSYGLTVASPNYFGELLQGPESGVGAGMEFQTTGTNGMSWQILNTGDTSAQGANKLNFRNDSAGIDVMTLYADGHVNLNVPYNELGAQIQARGGDLTYPLAGVFGQGADDNTYVSGDGMLGFGGSGPGDGSGGQFWGGDHGYGGDGITATAGSGNAGTFKGDVSISGNLTKGGGSFKIDHPLDPANKYLYHSFVESPDMMNIYNGVVVLDSNGEAVVQMPKWFSALNREFRYQLTCIGGFAPVYIAEELSNNEFKVGGGRAGMKISWQITGIRQDAWANAHRIQVEEQKNDRERGFYLHPELYGQPEEKQVEWARHPDLMRRVKHRRASRSRASNSETSSQALAAKLPGD